MENEKYPWIRQLAESAEARRPGPGIEAPEDDPPESEEDRRERELGEELGAHLAESDPVLEAYTAVEHAVHAGGAYAFERRHRECRAAGRCLALGGALPGHFEIWQDWPHGYTCHCRAAFNYAESIERAREFLELARAQAVLLGPDCYPSEDVPPVAGLEELANAPAAERAHMRRARRELESMLGGMVDEINAAGNGGD
jgi:hypothetical protein